VRLRADRRRPGLEEGQQWPEERLSHGERTVVVFVPDCTGLTPNCRKPGAAVNAWRALSSAGGFLLHPVGNRVFFDVEADFGALPGLRRGHELADRFKEGVDVSVMAFDTAFQFN
jgi:hypothetical protein